MFRAIYYKDHSMVRVTVDSREDAILHAIDNDIIGVQIINRPMNESPSSYHYYLVEDDIRGVNKTEFMRRVK
jgi:hypothetical protein